MSVITDVFDAVYDLANGVPGLFSSITVGALPNDSGITLVNATGAPRTTDMRKGMSYELVLTLNGKHRDQHALANTLANIHDALTQTLSYPSDVGWQITNIETVSAPSYIGRENDGQWLWGSSLRVKFYYKGV